MSDVQVDGARMTMRVAGPIGPVLRHAARFDLLDAVSREPNLEDVFLAQYGDTAGSSGDR